MPTCARSSPRARSRRRKALPGARPPISSCRRSRCCRSSPTRERSSASASTTRSTGSRPGATRPSPALFVRFAESQVGHNQPIILPPESVQLDYEGEIAVIIGKGGRRISEGESWEHIAGYACYNDGSIRDWQRHTVQWTAGKNFDQTGGFGPYMTTRGEIADGEELTLETRLNGQVMQHATTEMMIHRIPRLINYISTFTTLEPGDVIVTGTPGGVGARRTPPVWMKAGDKVEIEVTKCGTLVNTIKAG